MNREYNNSADEISLSHTLSKLKAKTWICHRIEAKRIEIDPKTGKEKWVGTGYCGFHTSNRTKAEWHQKTHGCMRELIQKND